MKGALGCSIPKPSEMSRSRVRSGLVNSGSPETTAAAGSRKSEPSRCLRGEGSPRTTGAAGEGGGNKRQKKRGETAQDNPGGEAPGGDTPPGAGAGAGARA